MQSFSGSLSSVRRIRHRWLGVMAALGALVVLVVPMGAFAGSPGTYKQANLISDIPGVARITDTQLVNPWGMAAGPSTPLWVADNGTDVSTLYTGGVHGSVPAIVPLTVAIPGGEPTGIVFNPSGDFVIRVGDESAPANFIFSSEAGQITAWSKTVSGDQAQTEFSSSTAVFKGLAIANTARGRFLYATDFHNTRVRVFDSKFRQVDDPGAFTDPNLPDGYGPFGIQTIDGKVYVTYAQQDGDRHDDVRGAGHGFVDVYDTSGRLLQRLISRGALNSPWGLVVAPKSFGVFGGDLLVGNFGDGTIHAYNLHSGALEGVLTNPDGNTIAIDGLWGLRFGNGVIGTPETLLFTAGLAGESHGLFGELTASR
jgi:uncharacterized protein (TIGR03118 family)